MRASLVANCQFALLWYVRSGSTTGRGIKADSDRRGIAHLHPANIVLEDLGIDPDSPSAMQFCRFSIHLQRARRMRRSTLRLPLITTRQGFTALFSQLNWYTFTPPFGTFCLRR
jgi:hypothetical protein